MKQLRYFLVDVFTNQPFGGNQLAVFPNASGLAPETMQALAKELNLSESAFVFPAQDAAHDYWVRFFTPAVELPMAGHPTVGTAFVLAHERMIQLAEPETTITFEEGVGVVPVTLQVREGQLHLIQMRQPLPTFGPVFADREAVAQMRKWSRVACPSSLSRSKAWRPCVPFAFGWMSGSVSCAILPRHMSSPLRKRWHCPIQPCIAACLLRRWESPKIPPRVRQVVRWAVIWYATD